MNSRGFKYLLCPVVGHYSRSHFVLNFPHIFHILNCTKSGSGKGEALVYRVQFLIEQSNVYHSHKLAFSTQAQVPLFSIMATTKTQDKSFTPFSSCSKTHKIALLSNITLPIQSHAKHAGNHKSSGHPNINRLSKLLFYKCRWTATPWN